MDIPNILGLFFGSASILYLVVKSYLDSRAKIIETKNIIKTKRQEAYNELSKEKFLAEVKDDDQFKRLIIDKIIDKYVDQTDRIFQMFEDEFKELVNNIQLLNKTIEKSYAQTEALRIQSKEFYEEYIKKLIKIEGVVLGMVGLFSDLQKEENLIKLTNMFKQYQDLEVKIKNLSENIKVDSTK